MYLSELFRLTDDNYLNNIINQIKNFLNKKNYFNPIFRSRKFSIEHLYEIRSMIRKPLTQFRVSLFFEL